MKKWTRSTLFKRVSTCLLALGMALVCGTAMGQDTEPEEFLLEDIIVTSEFREKSIQDTPLSISAVNADLLEARNQTNLAQISAQMPNVSLRPSNATYGSALNVYIRGIGQTDFNPSVEAGVGIYVDDVYYSTITGNIIDLLDLDRVEVLRGPQGTLAGRNALGGAIKLFTRQADGSEDGYVSVTYGDYDRLDIKGAGGFTVVPDKLFVRLAGVSRSRDGYITSYDYACHNNLPPPGNPGGMTTYVPIGGHDCELAKEGGQSMTAGRFSLRWMPSDNFTVNFAMNIVNDKSESQPSVVKYARDLVAVPSGVPIFFDNNGNGVYDVDIDIPYDSRFETGGTYYNYATYIDAGTNTPVPFLQGGVPGEGIAAYKPYVTPRVNHLDSRDYTLTLDWLLTDNVSLKSISSYREYVNIFADDNDGSPAAVQQLLQRMDHEQWTQELRLNATLWDGYADLTLGGFYLDQETVEDARVDLTYYAMDFIHGPDVVPSESEALYGQLSLHLSDRTDLTLGARYTKDEKSYTFQRRNPDASLIDPLDPTILFDIGQNILGLPPGIVVGPYPFDANQPANVLLGPNHLISVAYSSSQFDYRVALDYDFTEDIMGYIQVATGYRAGGNNARPFYPSQLNAFEPEELTNYEVGMKSTLGDQLRLNASVFFNDYTEIQLPLALCYFSPSEPVDERSPCASQDNVGDAEVQGFELEGVWRPTNEFALDFSYAYLDFEYTSIQTYEDDEGNILPKSNARTTPYTPENKWSLGAQYTFDLAENGDLTWRLDASYVDDQETVGIVGEGETIDSHTLLNGRVTWRSEDAKWEGTFEVTNLTDKYYYLTIFDLQDGAGSIFRNAQPGRPREYAFTIKRYWF